MVSVPRVEHALLHLLGDTACLVVRRLRVVCLPRCMAVEGLEIYDSPWFVVGFADNHSGVPTRPQDGHRGRGAL